jgi:hypothetical protein
MEKSEQVNITRSSHIANVSLRLFFRMSPYNPMWQFMILVIQSKELISKSLLKK